MSIAVQKHTDPTRAGREVKVISQHLLKQHLHPSARTMRTCTFFSHLLLLLLLSGMTQSGLSKTEGKIKKKNIYKYNKKKPCVFFCAAWPLTAEHPTRNPAQTPGTQLEVLHDTCLSRTRSFLTSPPGAAAVPKENAQPPLGARSPATERTLLGLFSPVQRRSLPALASSDPVTGPSLLSHQSTHTHTHADTQAGARSITPGRAHAHRAHRSATNRRAVAWRH